MELRGYFCTLLVILTSEAAHLQQKTNQTRKLTPCEKACQNKPMDISLVVDGSASIRQENFTLCLNFIEDFVNIFDISESGVRVSLVTFGEKAHAEDDIAFTDFTDKDSLREAISNIPYHKGQWTNTSGAIWHMLNSQIPHARENVKRVAIVMTDGNSHEPEKTKQAAKEARDKAGLEVFAIGIGPNVSSKELHNIASGSRYVMNVSAYNMLEDIKERLAYGTCDERTIPRCQMEPVDLSFVIDSSSSIGGANFTVGMEFVKDFVNSFKASTVRVSAVTFGEVVYEDDAFDFDTYNDKRDVLKRLSATTWRKGSATNTGAALRYMTNVQMTKARPTAAHVCVVLTDGMSQDTQNTKREARRAHESGIEVFAVGVGQLGQDPDQLDFEELANIAGDASRVLRADNYGKLNLLKEQLTEITCDGIFDSLETKDAAYRALR